MTTTDLWECDSISVRPAGTLGSAPNPDSKAAQFVWSIAIFAARENPSELLATIDAIILAASQPTIIDVMINGNPELAIQIAKQIRPIPVAAHSRCIRVWSIPLGGKAHAWNEYVHQVWPNTTYAFFVDGYARPRHDAFALLASALTLSSDAIAGTGVPSSGRTAHKLREEMLRCGGLQGSFFALKRSAIEEFRLRKFKLPLGLYGFDTLLGAVLGYGLDPSKNEWNAKGFILFNPDVTWTSDVKEWWRPIAVRTQFKRILNNALRVLVIKATKNFLAHRKLPPEQLPRTVEDFVLGWVRDYPDDARKILWKSPLCNLALAKLRQPKNWAAAEYAPQLIYSA